MPNHVTSRLTISGCSKEVTKIFDSIAGTKQYGEPMYIDFNTIKPTPESLMIESGSDSDTGLVLYSIVDGATTLSQWKSWEARRIEALLEEANLPKTDDGVKQFVSDTEDGQKLYALGGIVMSNTQKYGAKTWYEWCNREWGTKWNAYNQVKVNENTIEFDTAWAGVSELMCEIAVRHPEVELEYMFADENWGCNTGHYIFKGVSVKNGMITDGSPEALAIAEEILGPRPREDES